MAGCGDGNADRLQRRSLQPYILHQESTRHTSFDAREHDFWGMTGDALSRWDYALALHRLLCAVLCRKGRANERFKIGQVLLAKKALKAINDFQPGAGVDKVDGAKLDGAGSGHEELQRVFEVRDAANANNGDWTPVDARAEFLRDLVDHPQGDGLDGRA